MIKNPFHAYRWIVLAFSMDLAAGVLRVEISERSEVLNGASFGDAGAYERIKGRVHFAVDPGHAGNESITGIALANRDDRGRVRFSADLYMLRPRHGNRTILFEVVNRGKKRILPMFNRAQASPDPSAPEHFGDGFLLNAGYTLVWLGWQHDVPESPELMRIDVPLAHGVTGKVRGEYTPDKPAALLPLGDGGHLPYRPIRGRDFHLSVRDDIYGSRITVPPNQWSVENGATIRLKSPATPGRIYEFVYESANPPVAGLGLAAIRDLISYMKRKDEADFAIAFGISQSAMLGRAFLYEGFNQDENGKRVFDGLFAHVAGARRSTFQRFTQPSRTAGPLRNASLSPTEQFPFADLEQDDPVTDIRDGLLSRAASAKVIPKIFYTNSAYEYWGSGASLLHTTADGASDVDLPSTTRLYVFSGGQHGPAAFPPSAGRGRNLANFNDYSWAMRALLTHLQAWIVSGEQPPPSVYPSIGRKNLVPLEAYRFPAIPGVDTPKLIHTPHALDFGPEYREEGIVANEPPVAGRAYKILVPQADADGNDLGGIRMPEVACPIATWTGWNLRAPEFGAEQYLLGNAGSYIPFPRDPESAAADGDPRLSIRARYQDKSAYTSCVEQAAKDLAGRGFLLTQDIPRLTGAAIQHWRWRIGAPVEMSQQNSKGNAQ